MKPATVWDSKLNYQVNSSSGVYRFLKNELCMAERDREIFVLLALNAKGDVIGVNESSVGELSSAVVHPREVAKFLILSNASACILAHNHPSGDETPSQEDVETTRRLADVGKLIGIKVLDHIVISTGSYYSFMEHGDMRAM